MHMAHHAGPRGRMGLALNATTIQPCLDLAGRWSHKFKESVISVIRELSFIRQMD